MIGLARLLLRNHRWGRVGARLGSSLLRHAGPDEMTSYPKPQAIGRLVSSRARLERPPGSSPDNLERVPSLIPANDCRCCGEEGCACESLDLPRSKRQCCFTIFASSGRLFSYIARAADDDPDVGVRCIFERPRLGAPSRAHARGCRASLSMLAALERPPGQPLTRRTAQPRLLLSRRH